MVERVFTLFEILLLGLPFLMVGVGTASRLRAVVILGGLAFIVVGLWAAVNLWVTLLFVGCGLLALFVGTSELLA